MSLDTWSGVEVFMNGDENPDEWLHFVSNTRPQSLDDHLDRVEKLEEYRQAYMLGYDVDSYDLVNPETKYDSGLGGDVSNE